MTDITCQRCGKPIASKAEHAEMCPENFLDGTQLSHSLSVPSHLALMALEADNQRTALWNCCEAYIKEHEISCGETVYQSDSVGLSSLDLVDKICSIVGYLHRDLEAKCGGGTWPSWLQAIGHDCHKTIYVYLTKNPRGPDKKYLDNLAETGWQSHQIAIKVVGQLNLRPCTAK